MKKYIWMLLSSIAIIGGLYFVGVCSNYLFSYFSEPTNALRHEYLQGAAIAIMLSIPFWLAASAVTFPVRLAVPKWIWWGTNTITAVVCSIFLFLNTYPLVMVALGK